MAEHAHAMVTALDAAPALAEPGVYATLTAADVPGQADSGANRRDEPLFPT
jgi:xanthine dehydrogenase large subunit